MDASDNIYHRDLRQPYTPSTAPSPPYIAASAQLQHVLGVASELPRSLGEDLLRSTAAHNCTSGRDDVARNLQNQPASLIAASEGSAVGPVSNLRDAIGWQSTFLPSYAQLPSLDTIEQAPPEGATLRVTAKPVAEGQKDKRD